MLFKGTERFPKGQIDRLVSASAGQCNAETGEDNTHYWFAFPSDRWELALVIEADRMRGMQFDPREVDLERRVIGEERSRELNSPQGRLDQNHLALTYLRHPYRNPILGWPDDASRIGVEDLSSFYREHYRPDGAVLVVVGDVHPERTLDRIAETFERIPAGSGPRRRPSIVEPRQSGRRDFTIAETDGVARAVFGWRTVPRGHVDAAALDVLADLLCCGRRSRLWQSLVESDGVGDLGRGVARGGAARRAVLHPPRGRPGRRPGGPRRAHPPRVAPPRRPRADARGAVAVVPPPRSGLAMGTGGADEPGRRPRQRRTLG